MCVYMNINNEICSHTYELHVVKEKDKGWVNILRKNSAVRGTAIGCLCGHSLCLL